ncbi:MOSC domain-containing protein [Blastopirellula sp. JC732]|uniref:MOSC domain-containing protein n=1 Tax=Blastopirellula sediminis TaxID=2894196 RepID=A0A9X1SHQ8_9BACT|nr:MOSC domain-containing protein [Blastopirellula sediminis]MCC9606330.1 MOSC domain-containing protein [Blastopirellula sediminis]MCC9630372.1 MOSC domain-containing protein [Blastopirellula sediminis]
MDDVAKIVQLQIGQPKSYGSADAADPMDREWTTGFFKQPTSEPVEVDWEGIVGDGVADRVNHGGRDKAMLVYAAAHYPLWRAELRGQIDEAKFGNGAFGENLTVSDLDEEAVCLGDVYRVGTALLQVSQPRQPCWKLARRWRLKELTALAVKTGRMGWYVRVLEKGTLQVGDVLQLIERPAPDWTIARLNQLFYHDRKNLDDAAIMAASPLLAEAWRGEFRKRVEKAEQ